MSTSNTPYGIPQSIHATNLRVTLGDVTYRWFGGFGAVLQSRERRVKVGDPRMIGSVLFHASAVETRGLWVPRVSWTIPNDHISAEWIRQFKRVLFSVEVGQ